MILSNHATYTLLYFSQLWTFECGKAQSHSSMHSKPQQQPTLLFLHFVLLCFSFFWTFESKFEQNWLVFDTLINNAKHWSTVNKMTVGRQNKYPQRVTTTKWRHHFLFFFHFHHDMFGTNDDSKVTKKWKKVKKKWDFEQNWAGFARAPIHILVFWAILSKIEQFWAKLSKIEQDLPGPTNTFFSIAGHFEQFWAKLSRIYRDLQYQYFF